MLLYDLFLLFALVAVHSSYNVVFSKRTMVLYGVLVHCVFILLLTVLFILIVLLSLFSNPIIGEYTFSCFVPDLMFFFLVFLSLFIMKLNDTEIS